MAFEVFCQVISLSINLKFLKSTTISYQNHLLENKLLSSLRIYHLYSESLHSADLDFLGWPEIFADLDLCGFIHIFRLHTYATTTTMWYLFFRYFSALRKDLLYCTNVQTFINKYIVYWVDAILIII